MRDKYITVLLFGIDPNVIVPPTNSFKTNVLRYLIRRSDAPAPSSKNIHGTRGNRLVEDLCAGSDELSRYSSGERVIILSSVRMRNNRTNSSKSSGLFLFCGETKPVRRDFWLFVNVFSAEDLMKLQFAGNKSAGAQWSMPAYC